MMRCLTQNIRRRSWIAVTFLSLAAIGSETSAQETRPSVEALTGFFESVVFEAEYKETTQGSKVVKKWTGPIRLTVSAMEGKLLPKADGRRELKLEKIRPKDPHVKAIRRHLTTLVKLTGIKTEDSKKVGKPPNLSIKFVPRLAMHAPFLVKGVDPNVLKRLAQAGVCYFLTAAKDGAIVWGTIIVNIEMTDRQIASCLLEEMTQALGLPNDSDLVKPSIFNNRSVLQELTRNDKILIRSLYDKRLRADTPRAEAMAQISAVITEMDATTP